jgi:hypothetical protein
VIQLKLKCRKNILTPILELSEADREEIHMFAMKRSCEILSLDMARDSKRRNILIDMLREDGFLTDMENKV